VRGILFDLGVSSPQLDDPTRGFSFRADGPLDMRMDPTSGEPVSAWLTRAGEPEIREVIATLGEERFARRMPQTSCGGKKDSTPDYHAAARRTGGARRAHARARQTSRDAHLPGVAHAHKRRARQLRPRARGCARIARGRRRLAAISFHSLEDRAVKQFIQAHSSVNPVFAGLPLIPESAQPRLQRVGSQDPRRRGELARNPRARSSVLRVAEKVRVSPMSSARQQTAGARDPAAVGGGARVGRGAIYSQASRARAVRRARAAQRRRDNLEIEWGQLQLEQSAWSTHAFVENVAGAKLKMAMPPPKDIELVSP
jgi:16S rRNA (cytosine1402-N4)-methyltransferase